MAKNALLDFLQGASNSAASNVSAPVDGLAWLLRKAGANIGDAPVGGSDWMRSKGLTAEPANKLAGVLGESFGGVAPMLAAAKAPQIANSLLKMGHNAAIPQTLNKQAGMFLFHGSNDSRPLSKITDSGVFGGLFASPSERAALSHGDSLYRMTVPDSSVMNVGDELPWEHVQSVIGKNIRSDSPYADEIADMVVNAKSAFDSSIPEEDLLHALRSSDVGEADWELQRLRGVLGKSAGYKAVQMPDEHGMSYLVLPGTSPRPVNEASKQLYKQK